jgi:predicted ATPase with chaperone activity
MLGQLPSVEFQASRSCAYANTATPWIERLGLSPRAVHRILRVARTVADLAGLEVIETPQLTEAITYRRLGRKPGS